MKSEMTIPWSIKALYLISRIMLAFSIIFSTIVSVVLILSSLNINNNKADSSFAEMEFSDSKMTEVVQEEACGDFIGFVKDKIHSKQDALQSLPSPQRITILISTIIILCLIIGCNYYFVQFMKAINDGLFFKSSSISNLMKVSYLLLFAWTAKILSVGIQTIFWNDNNLDGFYVANQLPSLNVLMIALVIWVISHVFSYGVAIQEENELTI
jgi:hypothetical protein